MTVIVGIKSDTGCVIGADGRVSDSDSIVTDSFVKVRRFGSVLVAVYGADGRALEDLAEHKTKTYFDVLAYVRTRLSPGAEWGLLLYDKTAHRLLTLDADGTECEYARVAAAGCGGPIALGALSAGAAIRRAIKIASLHNSACGGRIRVLSAKKD